MEYLEKMKKIQNFILDYLDNEDDEEEKRNYVDFYIKQNQPDIQDLKSILYLISKISKNHHRKPFFFDKIH